MPYIDWYRGSDSHPYFSCRDSVAAMCNALIHEEFPKPQDNDHRVMENDVVNTNGKPGGATAQAATAKGTKYTKKFLNRLQRQHPTQFHVDMHSGTPTADFGPKAWMLSSTNWTSKERLHGFSRNSSGLYPRKRG